MVSEHSSILGLDGLDACCCASIVMVMVVMHEAMVCNWYCHS